MPSVAVSSASRRGLASTAAAACQITARIRTSMTQYKHVEADIDEHIESRDRENKALYRRIVRRDQRVQRIGADARPGEDLLDHHVGADEI